MVRKNNSRFSPAPQSIYYIQERNEDGRYIKITHGVRLLPDKDAAEYAPPSDCRNWLDYIRCIAHQRPWMCGNCLCPAPRVGHQQLRGVLVQEHELLDSRIFATHLCPTCYEHLRASGDYYVTNAYLIPLHLPITWNPMVRKSRREK